MRLLKVLILIAFCQKADGQNIKQYSDRCCWQPVSVTNINDSTVVEDYPMELDGFVVFDSVGRNIITDEMECDCWDKHFLRVRLFYGEGDSVKADYVRVSDSFYVAKTFSPNGFMTSTGLFRLNSVKHWTDTVLTQIFDPETFAGIRKTEVKHRKRGFFVKEGEWFEHDSVGNFFQAGDYKSGKKEGDWTVLRPFGEPGFLLQEKTLVYQKGNVLTEKQINLTQNDSHEKLLTGLWYHWQTEKGYLLLHRKKGAGVGVFEYKFEKYGNMTFERDERFSVKTDTGIGSGWVKTKYKTSWRLDENGTLVIPDLGHFKVVYISNEDALLEKIMSKN